MCVFETFRQQREFDWIVKTKGLVSSFFFLLFFFFFFLIILVIIKKTVKYGCFCVKVFFKTTMFYWLLSAVSFEKIYELLFFFMNFIYIVIWWVGNLEYSDTVLFLGGGGLTDKPMTLSLLSYSNPKRLKYKIKRGRKKEFWKPKQGVILWEKNDNF